ncbi:MAG: sugar phosphate isomerase/epimerase family protein [Planctomycetia bacterium]
MAGVAYNTNGFAHHRLEDALAILADSGYDAVALTPDVHHLDPLRATPAEVAAIDATCRRLGLSVIVETGARFVLDPARKHRPNLLDAPAEAARRLDFLCRCTDLGASLGARIVSTWSGALPEGVTPAQGWERLVAGLRALCEHAHRRGLRVAFEPEPGMLVERAADWPRVRDAVGHPALGLALDVGHCLAMREGQPAAWVRQHAADLAVLQVDDHRTGVHDHLMLGEGEVDFGALRSALAESGWRGPLEVELSRHSASAPATARACRAFLRERLGR